MTYASTILADSPLAYFKLEESTASTPADSGSAGGTGTIGGTSTNISTSQGGAASIGGSSWHFNNNQAFVQQTLTLGSTSDFTMETWYKRDTAFSSATNNTLFLYHNGTSHNCQVNIGSGGNIVVNINGTAVINAVPTGVTLNDGAWHHFVITQSGGTVTFYCDGVSKATGSGASTATNSSTTFEFGAITGGIAAWLDEVAFYKVALTSTQVSAHFGAGSSTPVTVTPPPATLSLAAPTPSVGVGPQAITPPAMTLSMAMATPNVSEHKFYNATASEDGFGAGTDSTTMSINSGNSATRQLNVQFANLPSAPAGKQLAATFSIDYNDTYFSGGSNVYDVYRITSAWSVSTNAGVPFVQPTTDATSMGSFTIPAGASGGFYSVDISSAANAWAAGAPNYGVAVVLTSGGSSQHFVGYGHPTAPPKLEVYSTPLPPNVTVIAPVMTMSMATATPVVIGGYGVTDAVPAMAMSLDAPAPVAIAGTGVTNTVPPMALSLDTATPSIGVSSSTTVAAPVSTMALTAPGGMAVTPDVSSQAGAMTASLTMVTPSVFIPAIVAAPAMSLSLATVPGTINLTTNVLKVAPVMTMSLQWVGIYTELNDRYLTITQENILGKDIWLKLNEDIGATAAVDSSVGSAGMYVLPQNVSFNNGITKRQDGPFLRKAVSFDGLYSYLGTFNAFDGTGGGSAAAYHYTSEPSFSPSGNQLGGAYTYDPQYDVNYTPDMPLTVEFSLRTTDLDGVIWTGWQTAGFQNNATSFPSGAEVRLKDGYMHFVNRTGAGNLTTDQKVRVFIADGKWHHIIVAFPTSNVFALDKMKGEFYVLIDGFPAMVREGVSPINVAPYQWAPWAFMGRPAWTKPTNLFNSYLISTPQEMFSKTTPTDCLAGDLSNLIIRPRTYIDMNTAQTIYYEWSNSNIVKPEPMELSLSMAAPKVKGSVKKMLALYGLNFVQGHGAPAVGAPGDKLYQYLDVLSGMVIKNLGGSINTVASLGGTRHWSAPVSFTVDDYLVIPVSIFGNLLNDSSYPMSTNGMMNPDAEVSDNGIFVNDENGSPRFINLQDDFVVDVTEEFDVITVVNYPWERQFDPAVGEYNYTTPFHGYGNMTGAEWEQARDDFRDSLMEAVYDGCSMWIGDYYMAMHLGFIQGYDIHDFGRWSWDGNTRAAQIDAANLRPGTSSGATGYLPYPQANFYRRITALVPGLTDLPGNDYGDWVEGWNSDEWKPNGNFIAYNILRRPNGLQLNDRVSMQMLWMGSHYYGEDGGTSLAKPTSRVAVTSAHPEGICGTVVSREQDFYYGPNGVVVQNPYKDNALTIAAEVGTVVRGRPIAGRVFIELMGTDWGGASIAEDADKRYWQGDLNPGVTDNPSTWPSRWDCDSRRGKEIKITISSSLLGIGPDGSVTLSSKKVDFFQYQQGQFLMNSYLPMAYRGLAWLSKTPAIQAGDARSFATAMNLTITTPAVTLDKTSSPASQVNGAMRLDLQLRQPANYADGNIEERAFPMEMSLEMRGLGRTVSAPPMSLTLTTPNPTLKVAADTVTVYLDEGRNITLFLKEDN